MTEESIRSLVGENAENLIDSDSSDKEDLHVGSSIVHDSQAGNKLKRDDRFSQYLHNQPVRNIICGQSEQTHNIDTSNDIIKTMIKQKNNLNVLSKLFQEDIPLESSDISGGLLIDEAQVIILEFSWRSKPPEKTTAFKDEYRNCFPGNEKSISFLQVPS
ncbi:unnamed protein product [Mytilus coruscus]|uniref:Uncharacterized protein n=1 Tax=Mytilus coruscus TaxID=42192 RepID=A0A6J8C6N9_MYTCO|nr:unnamed protein product [Mytilus coruscus]